MHPCVWVFRSLNCWACFSNFFLAKNFFDVFNLFQDIVDIEFLFLFFGFLVLLKLDFIHNRDHLHLFFPFIWIRKQFRKRYLFTHLPEYINTYVQERELFIEFMFVHKLSKNFFIQWSQCPVIPGQIFLYPPLPLAQVHPNFLYPLVWIYHPLHQLHKQPHYVLLFISIDVVFVVRENNLAEFIQIEPALLESEVSLYDWRSGWEGFDLFGEVDNLFWCDKWFLGIDDRMEDFGLGAGYGVDLGPDKVEFCFGLNNLEDKLLKEKNAFFHWSKSKSYLCIFDLFIQY